MKCGQVCLMLFSFTTGKEKNPALHKAKHLLFPSKKEKPIQVFYNFRHKKGRLFCRPIFLYNYTNIFSISSSPITSPVARLTAFSVLPSKYHAYSFPSLPSLIVKHPLSWSFNIVSTVQSLA